MMHVDFFKLQAKNLIRDLKTKSRDENGIYQYEPKFFSDIDSIVVEFDIDEDAFTLMKAQHIIAYLAGFKCWSDLIHANEYRLELGKLLLEHRNDGLDGPLLEKWKMYAKSIDSLDDESKLNVFKQIFLE